MYGAWPGASSSPVESLDEGTGEIATRLESQTALYANPLRLLVVHEEVNPFNRSVKLITAAGFVRKAIGIVIT